MDASLTPFGWWRTGANYRSQAPMRQPPMNLTRLRPERGNSPSPIEFCQKCFFKPVNTASEICQLCRVENNLHLSV